MQNFQPGLVHAPITPFTPGLKIDFGLFEKVLGFHLGHGAQALALPMHTGESVSLSDAEQRELVTFAIKQVKGRVPVIAHVSDAGTRIAADRARHAQDAGAAAVVATTPYYWTPPPAMVLEHFAQIGSAVSIPFFVFYTPGELGATKIETDQVLKLIDRLGNFAGLVDASLDWQFMINIVSNAWRVRPDFQLVSGTEYMVSAGAVGATSMFSSLSGVAPTLVRRLYDICRTEKYFDARQAQEDLAALRQIVKHAGAGGLKGAMRAMGRECGQPRPPLDALSAGGYEKLAAELGALAVLRAEPRGW
ncbi:MAG: dihydrodipicolinate synthase family protein [Pseudomonadota bacterium]|mgnify:CR=1 FL=1